MTSLETLIAQLKEAAAKATPGPYGFYIGSTWITDLEKMLPGFPRWERYEDAKYFSKLDPQTILTLITELEQLREMEREARVIVDDLQLAESRYRSAHDMHGDGHPTAGYCWDKMRQAGDRARAFLSKWGEK